MATTFSTTATVPQNAPHQQHAYRKSAQYSPNGTTTTTPVNSSPTSPRNSHIFHPRHQSIYQPRTAIGVPAALRKTEKPSNRSPPKIDSAVASSENCWTVGASFGSATNDGSATPVSQFGHEDMLNLHNDVLLSPVDGSITRNHWQADGSVSICSASSCEEPFGFFQRRHHCRKCGGIFCWQHSANRVRLDELARFHPQANLHRACDRCYSSFREWEHLRSSRNNSASSSSTAGAVDVPKPVPAKRPENPRVGSVAQSLHSAWNWSTF